MTLREPGRRELEPKGPLLPPTRVAQAAWGLVPKEPMRGERSRSLLDPKADPRLSCLLTRVPALPCL